VAGKRQTLYDQVMDSIAGRITAEFERRVAALEAHITDLEERLNARHVFSGDPTPEADRLAALTDAELIEEVGRHAREPQH
jgi:hypothetical protein